MVRGSRWILLAGKYAQSGACATHVETMHHLCICILSIPLYDTRMRACRDRCGCDTVRFSRPWLVAIITVLSTTRTHVRVAVLRSAVRAVAAGNSFALTHIFGPAVSARRLLMEY